jgi:hypothetical protein
MYRHNTVLKAVISSLPSVPAIVTISQVNQSVSLIQLQLTTVNQTTTTINDLTTEMSHNNTLIP